MIKNMRKIILFHLLILGMISISCKSEKNKINEKNEIIEQTIRSFEKQLFKTQIDSVVSKYNFNGIIAVYKDSIPLYIKSNGFANFKTKTGIDTLTVFGIASNSKQFTAALILLQMEDGKLNLNDKVSKYLDDFNKFGYSEITIQQLLNHTSGLNNYGEALRFKSGTDFHYSNDGYNVLGQIIEKVSGKSYEENAADLFKNVGMNHTYTNKDFKSDHFASAWIGNIANPQEVPNMPGRLSEKGIGNPAGGILSNAEDLNIWNQKLFSGKVLKPETLQKMTEKTATRMNHFFAEVGYGDGLMMYGDGPLAYFHTGFVKGLPSVNIYYPATKTSVIVLSNYSDESKPKRLIFEPHSEIRKISDGIQSAVTEIKKDLITEIQD